MTSLRVSLFLAMLCVIAGTTYGDVAFPARLVIEETVPGRYDVIFTLPIVEGRKLRAQPILPPICSDATEREISVADVGHTTSWTVTCDPQSLEGEAVLIEGLLGTQTDLAFTLTTLDGRVFSEILRPSRPGFLVPSPPSPGSLFGRAVVEGMRRVLQQLPLWLLMVVVVAARGSGWRKLLAGAVGFAVAHGLAQWLGGHGWLVVQPLIRDGFILVTAAVPAVALAGGDDRWRGWIRPLIPVTVLLGLLQGGARPETLPPDGLADVERGLALVAFAVGTGLGLMLISLAAMELRTLATIAGSGGRWDSTRRLIGYAVGSIAAGMIMARLVAMAMLVGDVKISPIAFALLAAVIGPTLAVIRFGAGWILTAFVVLAAIGLSQGLGGVALGLDGVVVAGSLLLFGGALAANRSLPRRWGIGLAAVAIVGHAWFAGYHLAGNVSRSTGVATGAVLAAACVLFASLIVSRNLTSGGHPPWLRAFGGAVALAAVLWRIEDYRLWFDTRIATEAVLGVIRVPVLSVLLVSLAALMWVRKRRTLNDLQMMQRSRVAPWILLGLAFLLVPHGTWGVSNPFFEPHAPEGEDARRVVTSVLWETYRAFNLKDEDELYDTLAENVTEDLVDDIYLDSRRRLTAGTREGAVVTVREVEVLGIGEPQTFQGAEGFTYDCRWAVTARVSHLQHVHLRQNTYSGLLTLKVDGDRWKIAGIELESEDRAVLWASAGFVGS